MYLAMASSLVNGGWGARQSQRPAPRVVSELVVIDRHLVQPHSPEFLFGCRPGAMKKITGAPRARRRGGRECRQWPCAMPRRARGLQWYPRALPVAAGVRSAAM